jgi:hypothetical protein
MQRRNTYMPTGGSEPLLESLSHFGCSCSAEGERGYLIRRDSGLDQLFDAPDKDERLARTRTGQQHTVSAVSSSGRLLLLTKSLVPRHRAIV